MSTKGFPRPEYSEREVALTDAQTIALVGCDKCQGDVDNCKPCTLAITAALARAARKP